MGTERAGEGNDGYHDEKARHHYCSDDENMPPNRPLLWSEMLRVYWIDRRTHSDFFWVFVIRICYYMGVSVQSFILFYLRDVVRVDDPTHTTAVLVPSQHYRCSPALELSFHPSRSMSAFIRNTKRKKERQKDKIFFTHLKALTGQIAAVIVALPAGSTP